MGDLNMNGAQAMIKCLEAEGIDIIFGYPGVAIAPFYDAMYDSSIKHVLTRQEQAAGHARPPALVLRILSHRWQQPMPTVSLSS